MEIEWYKLYKEDTRNWKLVKDWEESFINMREYIEKLEYSDYENRLAFMKQLIEILPKEYPYSVREYIVFN